MFTHSADCFLGVVKAELDNFEREAGRLILADLDRPAPCERHA